MYIHSRVHYLTEGYYILHCYKQVMFVGVNLKKIIGWFWKILLILNSILSCPRMKLGALVIFIY